MNFDKDLDRETRVRIWRTGEELGLSWKIYGSPRQLQQQLDAAGTLHSPMYITFMLGDVGAMLSEGKLIAIGFCVFPDISNGPVLVPADMFSEFQRRDLDTLMSDNVDATGWRYEKVKVLRADKYRSLLSELRTTKKESMPQTSPDAEVSNINKKKRGGGNISLYAKAKKVFEVLFNDSPHLKDEVADKIVDPFNVQYMKIYSPTGKPIISMSSRTIRRHLKAFRTELENIGKA